jgi:hypothetical protein
MTGNGQEEALLDLLGDVSNRIQEHWRGHYAQLDLSRDDEFKREASVDFAAVKDRVARWLEIDRAVGPTPAKYEYSAATWPRRATGDPTELTTRDAPCLLALSIEVGLIARQLRRLPDWERQASPTHCAALDKRLHAILGKDDILERNKLVCPNCGVDHEAKRAQWNNLGLSLSQMRCSDCGSYLDGSWECQGVGVGQHSSVRHPGTTSVCPTVVTVNGQTFRCRGTRPGYEHPAYCPGCLRAKGYPIDIVPVPLEIDPLPDGLDVCLNGHRLTPVCPSCGEGADLTASTHPDPRRPGARVPVHVCGKADCTRVSGGFPWSPCPECGYPLQPDGPDEFVTCPACHARSRTCPQCPPENPFRLIKQPESVPGQPDMSQVPSCPVHGALPQLATP